MDGHFSKIDGRASNTKGKRDAELLAETFPHAWELHPLFVQKAFRFQGVGTRLIKALENECANGGVITLYLGTANPKAWILREMNNIRTRAEEMVLHKLIYKL